MAIVEIRHQHQGAAFQLSTCSSEQDASQLAAATHKLSTENVSKVTNWGSTQADLLIKGTFWRLRGCGDALD
jgi:hypothetical protein